MTAPPPAGRTLGRRWELRAVASEAPGHVEYIALDRSSGADVSMWWLRPELIDSSRESRLLATASVLRRVAHPHVRTLVALAREEDQWIAVWHAARAPGPLPRPLEAVAPDALCAWADAVSRGLAELHRHGVVHGRLTPTDIVEVAGALCVGGAGLWTELDAAAAARAWRDRERWVAPEVRGGAAPTPGADVYSVGAILAEMIAGTRASLSDAMRVAARRHPPMHEILLGLTEADAGRRPSDLADAVSALRAAAAMPYLADDRSGPLRAIAYAPSIVAAAPAVAIPDPAHPAFAPLTPVPGTVVRLANPAAADVALSAAEIADAPGAVVASDFASREPGTIVGHAPAPHPNNRAVAGSLVVAPPRAVLHVISMKPPAPQRPSETVDPPPTAPRPHVRRISQAMVRTFATAPGALGYLAPPKAAGDETRRSRQRLRLPLAILSISLVILAAVYVLGR